jgi:chromosome partitioning protein
MKTIVIASGKGGSGKTTLTAHLAVAAGTAWVIDTDKQATLAQWHQRRQTDLAPAITEQTAAVLSLADLVMVPVRPSPADLWAVGGTMELVRRAGKPFLFVLCQAKPQASITAQAVAALSEHGRVARSFIVDRVAYASAMTSGNTAPELWPRGPTAGEIDALWAELKSCFAENMKTREVAYG